VDQTDNHPKLVPPNAQLVYAAAQGDQQAWDALVERYAGRVWAIARGVYRLGPTDAADVSQTTWLRLVENLNRIRDPESVGAWLAETAKNECLRLLRHAGRFVLDGEVDLDAVANDPPPGAEMFLTERDDALWRAIEGLSERCRSLMRLLMADPAPSYDEVAAVLDMPIGSIGPTRARCLDQLRRRPEIAGIRADIGDS
jgi:RNA polymerase sigma factor (sigma-70 family)